MKRSLTFAACLLAISAAHATYCPDGSTIESHPNNDCSKSNQPPKTHTPTAVPTTSTSTAGAAAGAVAGAQAGSKSSATGGKASATGGAASARQQQAQRQAQAQRTSVTGAGQGAGALAGAGAGSDNGNGNGATVNIDSANRSVSSTSYRSTIIPSFIPGGAAPLPATNIAVVEGKCGGQVMAIMREVRGRETHTRADTSEFVVGWTEVIRPLTDGNGIPTPFDTTTMPGYTLGHVWYRTTMAAGTSMDASFAVNVFGKNAGGGGGASAGGQITRPMSEVDIQPCVLAGPALPPPPTPEPRVIYRTRWRDRPVAAPVATPCCVAPPVCCTAVR